MSGTGITEKEIRAKNGNIIDSKKVMIEDQKVASEIIQTEMKLYRTSGQYIYFEKDTKVKAIIPATTDELAKALQKFYYKDGHQSYKKGKGIAEDISAFIDTREQNTRYISFNNMTIDGQESRVRKELVFTDQVIDVDNSFPFDIELDTAKWKKRDVNLLNKILSNYTGDFINDLQKKVWSKELIKATSYLITPDNYYEKAIMFKSKPGTGKSTGLRILQTIYGNNAQPGNIHSNDDFADTGILGKRLVFMDEMKDLKGQRKEQLQSMASGMGFNVRYSGGKNIKGVPRTKVMLLTNYDINLDAKDAMGDRLFVVPFITKVRGIDKYNIDNLFDRIKDPSFIGFFLSYMVKFGLKTLLEQGLKQDKAFINQLKNGSKENAISDFYNELVNDEISQYFKDGKRVSEKYTMIKPADLFIMFNNGMKDNNERNQGTKSKFKAKFDQYITSDQVCKARSVGGKTVKCYNVALEIKPVEEPEGEADL